MWSILSQFLRNHPSFFFFFTFFFLSNLRQYLLSSPRFLFMLHLLLLVLILDGDCCSGHCFCLSVAVLCLLSGISFQNGQCDIHPPHARIDQLCEGERGPGRHTSVSSALLFFICYTTICDTCTVNKSESGSCSLPCRFSHRRNLPVFGA